MTRGPAALRLTLAILLALLPLAALAAPPMLRFPAEAQETAARVEDPARMAFPMAGFDGSAVPMRQAEGRLDQRAWRLPGTRQSTLALLAPLQAQLEAAGYAVVFECETTACGGFDFRYAMDVLPEPDMHVDLGDFRYLLAEDGAGGLVSLLVSRALDQGFVQMTALTPGTAPEAPLLAPKPQAETAPAPQPQIEPQTTAAEAPAPNPPPPQSGAAAPALGQLLETTGAAPLDDLVFASGKAELAAGDYASLTDLLAWMQANPALKVTLVGHTDATGGLAGNIALSRSRAEAVRQRLIDLGADAARIGAEGAGYLAPRATNQTPEGRERNRRVEVMLTTVGTE